MAHLATGAVCVLLCGLLLGCIGLASARPVPAGGAPVRQTASGEVTSGGQVRRYQLHLPAGYTGGRPLPLVVNLHGFSANGTAQAVLSGMSAQADREHFIVVYPEGRGDREGWFLGPGRQGDAEVRFIRDLVTQLRAQYTIDAARIYATGMSNGGGLANRLGCEAADLFAAIAPVAGAYPFHEQCRPSRPLPVVAFHGTADPLVTYTGQGRALPPILEWAAAWARRNECADEPTVTLRSGAVTGQTWGDCRDGADVVLYTIEGGGHTWPGTGLAFVERSTDASNATEVIWDFFVAHPKGP